MSQDKSSLIVVCKANFCRSPVAMVLLRKYLGDKFIVSSGGIINFFENSMDKRSLNYLSEKGIKNIFHIPKKIDFKSLKNFDLVLSIDSEIFGHLKKHVAADKHFLFSKNDLSLNILDPINLKKKDEYDQCMQIIDYHCLLWSKNLMV